MKQQYYINKKHQIKTLKLSSLIGIASLAVLILFNLMFYNLSGQLIVSIPVGGAAFISLLTLYRTLFLLKFPVMIIDENTISYYNVLWYNKHNWDKFEVAVYNPNTATLSIGLINGRVFDRFLLESLSVQDIEKIKNHFVYKRKLTT